MGWNVICTFPIIKIIIIIIIVQTVVIKHTWKSTFKKEYIAPRVLRKETRYTTRYGASTRSVYVPKIFNELPDEILTATTRSKLKILLRDV